MSFFSLKFVIFIILTLFAYFLVPKKIQWVILLIASFTFYMFFSVKYTLYICFTITTVFYAAKIIERIGVGGKAVISANKATWSKEERKAFKETVSKKQRTVLLICLLLNFGLLALLKYYGCAINLLVEQFGIKVPEPMRFSLILPLGISFYTFQAMSYLIDVYRGDISADKNIAKFALFLSFFPQIIQGPISKYDQLAGQLYAPHKAEFKRFKYGLELIAWGVFKKLVIADRIAIAVTIACKDYAEYNGLVLFAVSILYAFQLYADFSAGIDISRGIAEMLGIDMIQNFKQPYFATSLSDFWNRWHISLGAWMKNYIFYPIALSKTAQKVTKAIRETRFGQQKFGEHFANVLPGSFACIVIFLVVGIWHGAGYRFVLYGLWNGIIIMLSMIFKPTFSSMNKMLHINEQSFGMRVFRIVRTFALVCIGNITDLVLTAGASIDFFLRSLKGWNYSIAADQVREELELVKADYIMIVLGILVMFIVGVIRERNKERSLRDIINSKPFLIQWAILFFGIISILVFGVYGEGYNISDFAYVQF